MLASCLTKDILVMWPHIHSLPKKVCQIGAKESKQTGWSVYLGGDSSDKKEEPRGLVRKSERDFLSRPVVIGRGATVLN